MYDCILVGLDGSLESEAVLPEVEKLLTTHPGKVVLLSAVPEVDIETLASEVKPDAYHAANLPRETYNMLLTANEERARRYLDAIAKQLATTGATPEIVVSYNNPSEAILFYTKHYKADLIAMATHGRSGFNRLLHGSITENVLHHIPCPMLVVRTSDVPMVRFAPEVEEMPALKTVQGKPHWS